MASDTEWTVHRLSGTVGELHAMIPDPGADREVWLMSPLDTALVLGSAQPIETAGGQASDEVAVVRRRSGGGAVMVTPGDSVWIDVVINRSDPLWHEDVNQAPLWLGQVWVAALASLGVTGGEVVHRFRPGPWGRLACFASQGPGEVLVEGAKAVGISQRRTRTTARFQTFLYRRWNPEVLIACLTVATDDVEDFRAELASAAWAVNADIDEVQSAFLAALP